MHTVHSVENCAITARFLYSLIHRPHLVLKESLLESVNHILMYLISASSELLTLTSANSCFLHTLKSKSNQSYTLNDLVCTHTNFHNIRMLLSTSQQFMCSSVALPK